MVDIIDFRNDRSGVSPVIGVILMVAVTVIIAAVIGSTALGLGDEVSETPPNTQFETENDQITDEGLDDDSRDIISSADIVTLSVAGGDTISSSQLDNLKITIDGEPAYAAGPEVDTTDPELTDEKVYPDSNVDDDRDIREVIEPGANHDSLSAGDEIELAAATSKLEDNGATPEDGFVFVDKMDDDSGLIHDWGGNTATDRNLAQSEVGLESGQTLRVIYDAGDSSQVLYETELNF